MKFFPVLVLLSTSAFFAQGEPNLAHEEPVKTRSIFDLRIGTNYGFLLGGLQRDFAEESITVETPIDSTLASSIDLQGIGFDFGLSGYFDSDKIFGLDISYHIQNIDASSALVEDDLGIYNSQSIQAGLILRFFVGNPTWGLSALFVGGGIDHTWLKFDDDFRNLLLEEILILRTDSAKGFGFYLKGGYIAYLQDFHIGGDIKFTSQNPKFEDALLAMDGDILHLRFFIGVHF